MCRWTFLTSALASSRVGAGGAAGLASSDGMGSQAAMTASPSAAEARDSDGGQRRRMWARTSMPAHARAASSTVAWAKGSASGLQNRPLLIRSLSPAA
jgi:hypothetical protein